MNSNHILERAASGVRWTLVLSMLAMPLSYLTNVLLGRITPEALGAYGSIAVFVSFADSVLLFGGRQTFIRFLPQLPAEKKWPFIFTNLLLMVCMCVGCGVLFYLNPALAGDGLGTGMTPAFGLLLVLLASSIILLNVCLAVLQAQMEIRGVAIAERLIVLVNFGGAVMLFLFFRAHAPTFFFNAITFVIFLAYLVPLVLIVAQRVRPWPKLGLPRLFLPNGFWSFVLWAEIGIASYFILDRLDQVLVVARFSLGQLGMYRAALSTAQFVRWLPLALSPMLLPTFANLFAAGDHAAQQRTYERFMRYGTLGTSIIALGVIVFAEPILNLFGRDYVSGTLTLIILSAGFIPSFILAVSTNVAIARGGIGWPTVNGLFIAALQIILSLWFLNLWGPAGVALAKVLSWGMLTMLNTWYAARLTRLALGRGTWLILWLDAMVVALCLILGAWPGLNYLLIVVFVFALFALRIVGRAEIFLLRAELQRLLVRMRI